MTFLIKENADQQLITVKTKGSITLEELESMRDVVLTMYEDTGFKRVCLDMYESTLKLEMREILKYIHNCRGIIKMKELRISGVINLEDDVSNYIQLFLSSVGFSIYFFYKKEEAIKWLQAA